jgi:hypothetical protein
MYAHTTHGIASRLHVLALARHGFALIDVDTLTKFSKISY